MGLMVLGNKPPATNKDVPLAQKDPVKDSISVTRREYYLKDIITTLTEKPWKIDYYSQILAENQEPVFLSDHLDPVNQSYNKIKGLVINVVDPLTSSMDDNNIATVTGSAQVISDVVPNISDVIVAELLQGEVGLFKVTDVTQNTFNKKAVKTINYELVDYITPNSAYAQDLFNKTAHEYIFDKDLQDIGKDPLVPADKYSSRKELKQDLRELMYIYLKRFIDINTETLLIPDDNRLIYDDYHVEFVQNIFSVIDQEYYNAFKRFNVREEYDKNVYIWDVFINRHIGHVSVIKDTIKIVDKKKALLHMPTSMITYTIIEKLIHGNDNDLSISENFTSLKNNTLPNTNLVDVGYKETKAPIIYPVTSDDKYVFTNHFYQKDDNQSILEKITNDYIDRKSIDITLLNKVISFYKEWPPLEQYYYGPIIAMLIKYTLDSYNDIFRSGTIY